jgi:hypothetical protein
MKFVDYLLESPDGNITEAATKAGYASPSFQGSTLLKRPRIKAEIARRTSLRSLKADETLKLLGSHALGSMDMFTSVDKHGRIQLDFAKAKKLGAMNLVKKLTIKADGSTSIELYDAQAALALLAKHHGLLTERVQVTHVDDRADLRERIIARLADRVAVSLPSPDAENGTDRPETVIDVTPESTQTPMTQEDTTQDGQQ